MIDFADGTNVFASQLLNGVGLFLDFSSFGAGGGGGGAGMLDPVRIPPFSTPADARYLNATAGGGGILC